MGAKEYSHYRIQINGVVFPDSLIEMGSYKITPNIKRKISEFYDANGRKHVIYYPRTGAKIEFKLRMRTMEEQEQAMEFFQSEGLYDIVYWDDKVMDYRTVVFWLADPVYKD